MPTLVDLSRTLDPANRELVPESYKALETVLAPKIHYLHPSGEGRDRMTEIFGCPADHLPNGEGWGEDWLTEMNTHCGTHVDAPLHSGSLIEGREARTISDIDLSELYAPGMILDVREWVEPGRGISIEALERAIAATGREVQQGDALPHCCWSRHAAASRTPMTRTIRPLTWPMPNWWRRSPAWSARRVPNRPVTRSWSVAR